jgi:hypothetical protein
VSDCTGRLFNEAEQTHDCDPERDQNRLREQGASAAIVLQLGNQIRGLQDRRIRRLVIGSKRAVTAS